MSANTPADKSVIRFVKLHSDAQLPKICSDGAAAYDLYNISPDCRLTFEDGPRIFSTGIGIELAEGYAALVCSRSGWAAKGVIVMNSPGIIDPDYRGEIKVILANLSSTEEVIIRKHERIAQLLIVKIYRPTDKVTIQVAENFSTKTVRGDKGFGSTGVL